MARIPTIQRVGVQPAHMSPLRREKEASAAHAPARELLWVVVFRSDMEALRGRVSSLERDLTARRARLEAGDASCRAIAEEVRAALVAGPEIHAVDALRARAEVLERLLARVEHALEPPPDAKPQAPPKGGMPLWPFFVAVPMLVLAGLALRAPSAPQTTRAGTSERAPSRASTPSRPVRSSGTRERTGQWIGRVSQSGWSDVAWYTGCVIETWDSRGSDGALLLDEKLTIRCEGREVLRTTDPLDCTYSEGTSWPTSCSTTYAVTNVDARFVDRLGEGPRVRARSNFRIFEVAIERRVHPP